MLTADFELRLTQYLDGTLPTEEAAALFELLAASAEALTTLDEHRQLDAILQSPAPDLSSMGWNALSARISRAVDREAEQQELLETARRSRFRIGGAIRYAAAACLLLAVGVGTWSTLRTNSITPGQRPGPSVAAPIAVAQISGPSIEASHAVAVSQIAIGPSPVAARNADARYAELAPPAPQVAIASGVEVRQDAAMLPY